MVAVRNDHFDGYIAGEFSCQDMLDLLEHRLEASDRYIFSVEIDPAEKHGLLAK